MKNLRKYGEQPFNVAVIHGGPGASGEMAPVAKELALENGILEPLQTKLSIEGQVEELKTILNKCGDIPVVLISHSWGAWLSLIVAANYPSLVKKIILVASSPFKEKYTSRIMKTRLKRLGKDEREEVKQLISSLNETNVENEEKILTRFGELMSKADSFAPLPRSNRSKNLEIQQEIYQRVGDEASQLRKSGKLLELAKQIECPVVAIHGDYDPHPYKGVKEPLSEVIKDFKWFLLKDCGHTPWIERKAKDKFYKIIEEELN